LRLEFVKMNGAANDFVLFDGRDGKLSLTAEQIQFVCHRRRGVGADGLIVIRPPAAGSGADFHMEFYNSDGVLAEMCGNGSRCAAHFGASLGLGRAQGGAVHVRVSTDSGPIDARVAGDRVRAEMMDAREMRRDIPVRVAQAEEIVHFMIVGTRHAVSIVDDARALTASDVKELGRAIRYDPAFGPVGANVNFASVDEEGKVHLRTYEKGVEAETHACGTGSVAASVILAHLGRLASPATVLQHSGDELTVSFELVADGATGVTLEGPVAVNFAGSLEL
jgi:diaminopimelate epimerase